MKVQVIIEVPEITDPDSPEADALVDTITQWTEEVRQEMGWMIYVDDAS